MTGKMQKEQQINQVGDLASRWATSRVRTIPDFPKKGIQFRDITTLLADAKGFRKAVDELVQPYVGVSIDKVAGIEARGFILGGAIAHQLACGFIPIRKPGKLPIAPSVKAISLNMAKTGWKCMKMRCGQAIWCCLPMT